MATSKQKQFFFLFITYSLFISVFFSFSIESSSTVSSDTLLSSTTATCSEFQFQCKSNAVCIPLQMKCDLSNDCDDGSDENATECKRTPIIQSECDNENFLHCKYSGKCIPKEWVCDAEHDCGLIGKFNLLDPSDENVLNCTKKCPINQLPCSNGVCLHISKFCDGNVDCPNDEQFCSDKSVCKSLHCEYDCKSTSHGPKCYCPKNHDIINTTKCALQKTCSEDDESDGETCDQLCSITKGRNKCVCAAGYERINHKCFGVNCE